VLKLYIPNIFYNKLLHKKSFLSKPVQLEKMGEDLGGFNLIKSSHFKPVQLERMGED